MNNIEVHTDFELITSSKKVDANNCNQIEFFSLGSQPATINGIVPIGNGSPSWKFPLNPVIDEVVTNNFIINFPNDIPHHDPDFDFRILVIRTFKTR